MEQPTTFGQIVRERRSMLGLTQAELARRAGCAPITIRKIEGNVLRPSVQLAELLALALNIPEAEQIGFVRLARHEKPPSPIPKPTPSPGEIGLDDLSGRAVKGFQLAELIGSGGFGVVYRAVQPSVQRDVAVKIILPRFANHPTFIRRFEAEAHLIARLEHPHIVPLYDYWREPNAAYLIMRLLRGGSLDNLLQEGSLSLDVFRRIVLQVGQALAVAHANNIVHRDIKPANVLLDEAQNAYLGDFGIAKNLELVGDANLTENGALIGSPAYISPEQIQNEPIRPSSDIYCFGLLLFEMLTGRKAFEGPTPIAYLQQHLKEPVPSLLGIAPDLPPDLEGIVQKASAKEPENRFPHMDALLESLEAVLVQSTFEISASLTGEASAIPSLSTQEIAALDNPYRGLQAFTEADAANFFGREALVQELLSQLSDGSDLERFVAVVGPSGSGKSSLVKAGLLPVLRRGGLPGSDSWFIVDMTPGSQPWEEFETALLRVAVNLPESILEQTDNRGLLRTVQRILPDDAETELLLVIDQFEELFTLVEDEAVQAQFLESLVTAVLDPTSRLRIVITLRADFMDRPLDYVDFGEILRQRLLLITPLTPDELTQAITQPAQNLGITMAPELVATVIQDVGDQPGMLPLLQYALTELFEQRQSHLLTLDSYQLTGGVTGALARRADEIYNSLAPANQEATRQLFLRLITLGEGASEGSPTPDTRRRVLLTELESLSAESSIVNRKSSIVSLYGRHRLLTFDHDPVTRSPTVEVAHEALLREWPRLQGWLRDGREDVRRQREVAEAARRWQANNQDDSFLLRGGRLAGFESWLETTSVLLTADERTYLQASLAAREARQAAEEARRQRELETAQQLAKEQTERAEEQAQSAQSLRQRALFLTGALLVAATLAVLAFSFARSSNNNANLAITREVEAIANLNLAATNEAEAIISANLAATREVEAETAQELSQAEADIRATAEIVAIQQRDAAQQSEREALEAYSLSLAANARQALAAGDTELALLLALAANDIENPPVSSWQTLVDVTYAPAAQTQFTFADTTLLTFATTPDDKTLFVGTENGELHLYNLETKELIVTLLGHEEAIYSIAVSPNGEQLLSGANDGTAILWDLESGEIVHELTGHNGVVENIEFFADGTRAIIGADPFVVPANLTIWDLENGHIISRFGATLEGNREGVRGLALLPGEELALVGLGSQNVTNPYPLVFWDIVNEEVVEKLNISETSSIFDVDISPDGNLALLASSTEIIYLMDLESREVIQTLQGHTEIVDSVSFSPNGKTAVSGGRDDVVIWWEVETGRIINRFTGHTGDIRRVAFLNQNQIVSSSDDGSVRIWNLHSNWEQGRFTPEFLSDSNYPMALAITPDGQSLLLSTFDRSFIRIDYESGEYEYLLKNYEATIVAIAVSGNGKRALTGLSDGSLIYWNLQSGQQLRELTGHAAEIRDVDISEDGQFGVSASLDGQVFYWNLQENRILHRMSGHPLGNGVTVVKFLQGEQTAVSGAVDGSMVLWDLATGEQIKRLTGLGDGAGTHIRPNHGIGIFDIAISPNGQQILSSGYDQSFLLWELTSGESKSRLSSTTGFVFDLLYTPNGQTALSTTQNYTFVLWDVEQAALVRAYNAVDRSPGADNSFTPHVLAVHPSGETTVTIERSTPIIKWRLTEPSPEELIDWIENNRLLRELTCVERETYQIQPLCNNGVPAETTADILANVKLAVATIDMLLASPQNEITSAPVIFESPVIETQTAVIGENRGELKRNEFDVWTFNASAGEIYSIQMIADKPMHDFLPALTFDERFESGALDPVLLIIGPDGTLLERANDSTIESGDILTDVNIDAFLVPENGTYRIEARSYLDDNEGEYSLNIEVAESITVDPVLLEEYSGHYLEGPWEFDVFNYVEDGNLKSFIEQTAETFDLIPTSETEFIVAGDGSIMVFTRDASGQIDGYEIWVSLIHSVNGGQWYRAERIEN